MSEILLFRITEMNWNEIDIQSDILISQVWSVIKNCTYCRVAYTYLFAPNKIR